MGRQGCRSKRKKGGMGLNKKQRAAARRPLTYRIAHLTQTFSSESQQAAGSRLYRFAILQQLKRAPLYSSQPAMRRATWTPLAEAWDREWVMPLPSPMMYSPGYLVSRCSSTATSIL